MSLEREVMTSAHNQMDHQTNSLWGYHYSLATGIPEMDYESEKIKHRMILYFFPSPIKARE
jgi:hypothetical protein